MKELVKEIDAQPSKRIYLSIMADYQLKTALCELIDNAIDSWIHRGKRQPLKIEVDADDQRQVISVTDNSGGVPEDEISLIVSPGHSRNTADDATIGIFGVGSKRAVVALAEEIKIFTRHRNEKTILVEIDDAWIRDDNSWDLPMFYADDIAENTTIIELTKLRNPIKSEDLEELRHHLGTTYALFLGDASFQLALNRHPIEPVYFNQWSYPPGYEPREFSGQIDFGPDGVIDLDLLGGLTTSGQPSGAEYGAYFYCNQRLVAQAYKGPEVGYRALKIGNPHPSVSLARVVVRINGPAKLMPWNSSKSDINPRHASFKQIQGHIDRLLTHYSLLSRKWSTAGGWEDNVFQYDDGEIQEEEFTDISSEIRIHLPPIPRLPKTKYTDVVKRNNKDLAKIKPWVTGLYETIIAVDEISKLRLDQKNRITFLMLDSMLEIAFKEYLNNESKTDYSSARWESITQSRTQVQTEVKKTAKLSATTWKKIDYYYRQRIELVHKRATVTISPAELADFRELTEEVLTKLFGLNFKRAK